MKPIMTGTHLKGCNVYARIWKNSGANGTLLEIHAKTVAKPDLFGYALFVKLKQNDTKESEDMNKCGICNTWMRGLIVSRNGKRYANYCKKCVDGDDNVLSTDRNNTRRNAL